MRHYHGTPIGGRRANADQFCDGRFVLIPWIRQEDLERAMAYSRGFMVDNSAFTFWKTQPDAKPQWSEYVKWCRSIARHPRFDFALIPDVIDGSEEDNDDLIAFWDKHAWHPVKIPACTVWHLHESFDRLERLVSRHERVALGSSGDYATIGTDDWLERMDDAFDVIADDDGYPRAKIHGLRMLRSDVVLRYPFASCDSTNAVQNGAREAKKNCVDALWGQMTIARRIEAVVSPSRWIRTERQADLFELLGRR